MPLIILPKPFLSGPATAAAPTFSPTPGTFGAAQAVSMSSASIGASIYYTTDGSIPTTTSNLYTAPITIGSAETVSAIAIVPGMAQSAVSVAQFLFMAFAGEMLPGFVPGTAYLQNIAGQASLGIPPFTFSLVSQSGPNAWFVSSAGVITGTPGGVDLVTDAGVFLVTDTGVQLIT